ncbi:hypothetical protein U9K47_18580 [Bacillus toyonensis]|uniref:hypothetical protein n=1 Tax=Bacillus toyonensis TaxID=155322 RepID=UPI0034658BF9
MILNTLKPFLTRKKIISLLLGWLGSCIYSIYNVLCPQFNTGTSFSIPVFWPVIKFQSFGMLVIILGLLVLITFPWWKSNYEWFADFIKKKYNDLFNNN